VILPFSDTEHKRAAKKVKITKEEWKFIFKNWIKKAVESFSGAKIDCKCSGANPGNFIKKIVRDIDQSEIVIADLTGSRPNVYYELGIRHALRNGTIIITQEFNALPSDLKSYQCFEYYYTSQAHKSEEVFNLFEKEMHGKLEYIIEAEYPDDSPVSDFRSHERASPLHGDRFEFIKQTNVKLHDLVGIVGNIRTTSTNTIFHEASKDFGLKIRDFYEYFDKHKVYISEGSAALIRKAATETAILLSHLKKERSVDGCEDPNLLQRIDDAYKRVGDSLHFAESEVRKLLGVEESTKSD